MITLIKLLKTRQASKDNETEYLTNRDRRTYLDWGAIKLKLTGWAGMTLIGHISEMEMTRGGNDQVLLVSFYGNFSYGSGNVNARKRF